MAPCGKNREDFTHIIKKVSLSRDFKLFKLAISYSLITLNLLCSVAKTTTVVTYKKYVPITKKNNTSAEGGFEDIFLFLDLPFKSDHSFIDI